MKYTYGNFLHIVGTTSTNKSTPFLNVNLLITTILTVFNGYLLDGSGLNLLQSTALGITLIFLGSNDALMLKFSLLICDTDTAWSTSDNINFKILLTWNDAASLNANNEWSVNTVLKPNDFACNNNSPPKNDVAAWECTICISSLNNIYLNKPKLPIYVNKTTYSCAGMNGT